MMIETIIISGACLIAVFAALGTVAHLYKYTRKDELAQLKQLVESLAKENIDLYAKVTEVTGEQDTLNQFIKTAEANMVVMNDRINGLSAPGMQAARQPFGPKIKSRNDI